MSKNRNCLLMISNRCRKYALFSVMVDIIHRYTVLRVNNATNEKLACIVLHKTELTLIILWRGKMRRNSLF